VTLRRAGWLHDLGRVAVSAGIWTKPGALSDGEWERVKLYPYHTERILARSEALAPIGALAALHHERLDGSGYHRGLGSTALSLSARVLAVADVYQALVETDLTAPHERPTRRPTSSARKCAQGALTARRRTPCLPRRVTECEVLGTRGRRGLASARWRCCAWSLKGWVTGKWRGA
jgi:hypothetical protein